MAKIEEESDDNSSDSHDDVTGTLTNSVGGVPIQAASCKFMMCAVVIYSYSLKNFIMYMKYVTILVVSKQ